MNSEDRFYLGLSTLFVLVLIASLFLALGADRMKHETYRQCLQGGRAASDCAAVAPK